MGGDKPAAGGGGEKFAITERAGEQAEGRGVPVMTLGAELQTASGGHVEAGAIGDDGGDAAAGGGTGAEGKIDGPEARGGIGRIDKERGAEEAEVLEHPGGGPEVAADPEHGGGGCDRGGGGGGEVQEEADRWLRGRRLRGGKIGGEPLMDGAAGEEDGMAAGGAPAGVECGGIGRAVEFFKSLADIVLCG